ncbi:unnamed protein product [Dovyalis caffra]|uniref:Amino acid transporter transmembrane domain-containing protein n=1 Tax=Dovyalis caffra TaxID=77055 RepID=A0AAV1RGF0_9ROSI|nr:unnamed protein product [Dovyalis caffra]
MPGRKKTCWTGDWLDPALLGEICHCNHYNWVGKEADQEVEVGFYNGGCAQITLSMPRHFILTKIALWATVFTPMTKYALEFAPFAIQLERNLPDSISSRTKTIIGGAVGSILLLIILALALSVPYFEHVLSLTGSLVSVSICMLFPCAFYIKLSWAQISKPVLILNVILLAFGLLLGVVGSISSSKLLVTSLKRARSS